jgi:hypothetical protein
MVGAKVTGKQWGLVTNYFLEDVRKRVLVLYDGCFVDVTLRN